MAELADAQDLGSCEVIRVGSTPTTRTITLEQDFLREILALKFFRNKIIKSKIIHNTQKGDTTLVAGAFQPLFAL